MIFFYLRRGEKNCSLHISLSFGSCACVSLCVCVCTWQKTHYECKLNRALNLYAHQCRFIIVANSSV